MSKVLVLFIGLVLMLAQVAGKAIVTTSVGGTSFAIQAAVAAVPMIVGVILILVAFVLAVPFCAMLGV